jgi:hypothetical protein
VCVSWVSLDFCFCIKRGGVKQARKKIGHCLGTEKSQHIKKERADNLDGYLLISY